MLRPHKALTASFLYPQGMWSVVKLEKTIYEVVTNLAITHKS